MLPATKPNHPRSLSDQLSQSRLKLLILNPPMVAYTSKGSLPLGHQWAGRVAVTRPFGGKTRASAAG
jgi:hypothetical protein